jgi:signal peptidase I
MVSRDDRIDSTVNDDAPLREAEVHREMKLTVLRFIVKLLLVILAVWAIFTFVFGIDRVSGDSMYPGLRDGDLILYYRLEKDYRIDDVVTFTLSGTTYQARIVAQEGDTVDLSKDGQLIVNGNVQQEEIFFPTEDMKNDISYPYTVEADSYFVLCDYRTAGIDSRTYGTIPQSAFAGKIITVLRRRGI